MFPLLSFLFAFSLAPARVLIPYVALLEKLGTLLTPPHGCLTSSP